MQNIDRRSLTHLLAEDFGWLEEHCRKDPAQAPQALQLRLAAALVRNCIGPFLDGQAATPLHIAVVGGAGAGKSTVSNLLSGAVAAEANPQAGFTRHPIAFTNAAGAAGWAGHFGFLGKLQRLTHPTPSSLDSDVYQVRSVPGNPEVFSLLQNFVVWDCPDMTTWAATGYVPRLLEIVGLADVVVYVASDERYNDEVPTQFLRLFLQAGKPVVCCLTKMREADVAPLLDHFHREVIAKLPKGSVASVAIPHLSSAQLSDPAKWANKYRVPLLNQIAAFGEPAVAARHRNVRCSTNYLVATHQQFMDSAKDDVAALEQWQGMVQAGRAEFEQRYQREYLASEKYRRFDESLVKLVEMLELPGIGQALSNALYVVRTPYRLIKGWLGKQIGRPESSGLAEQPVLEAALAGWLDLLRKETAEQNTSGPFEITPEIWTILEKGFAGNLSNQAREQFHKGLREFQRGMAEEVERTARAIYEDLAKNPVALNALRGSKFALDVVAITTALATGGIGWSDLILVPLAAAISQLLVEFGGAQYVENQREHARKRQQALVAQYLSGPLAEWLIQWPASNGSPYERLQLALQRIPSNVGQLDAVVTKSLAS